MTDQILKWPTIGFVFTGKMTFDQVVAPSVARVVTMARACTPNNFLSTGMV
jgi:hypothetical protein